MREHVHTDGAVATDPCRIGRLLSASTLANDASFCGDLDAAAIWSPTALLTMAHFRALGPWDHSRPTEGRLHEQLHPQSRSPAASAPMQCAYAFAAIAFIGLPVALEPGGEGNIAWIAQTFLQLVLLSIIIVGQNIAAASSDTRSANTFKNAYAN